MRSSINEAKRELLTIYRASVTKESNGHLFKPRREHERGGVFLWCEVSTGDLPSRVFLPVLENDEMTSTVTTTQIAICYYDCRYAVLLTPVSRSTMFHGGGGNPHPPRQSPTGGNACCLHIAWY